MVGKATKTHVARVVSARMFVTVRVMCVASMSTTQSLTFQCHGALGAVIDG